MADTAVGTELRTLGGVLRQQASERPDDTFVEFQGRRWTFQDVHDQA